MFIIFFMKIMPLLESYHLDDTLNCLQGPTKEQMKVWNQWAATALNIYHENSNSPIEFVLDDAVYKCKIHWDSDFPNAAMKERKELASQGGISLACFKMSVLLKFEYVIQTEIGSGVDYMFLKRVPDNENFIENYNYVEVSGLLEEKGTNTLLNRLKDKHQQIEEGSKRTCKSSVIVTLFAQPKSIRETHHD